MDDERASLLVPVHAYFIIIECTLGFRIRWFVSTSDDAVALQRERPEFIEGRASEVGSVPYFFIEWLVFA